MPVGAKRLARGSTVLTHVYDGVVRVFVGNLYERQYYLEDCRDGLAQKWTAATGTWAVTGGGYRQSATTSNTNAYRAWAQGSAFNYEWKATYTSGTSAGFYLFASASTGAERGNSYRIWQDATTVKLYESANDVATLRTSWAAANPAGAGGCALRPAKRTPTRSATIR